jgi:hypothetical protein
MIHNHQAGIDVIGLSGYSQDRVVGGVVGWPKNLTAKIAESV